MTPTHHTNHNVIEEKVKHQFYAVCAIFLEMGLRGMNPLQLTVVSPIIPLE